MKTTTKSEKTLKLAVAQAADQIRNKFKEIHNQRKETDRLLEEQYKPITKKLKDLIDVRAPSTAYSSPSTEPTQPPQQLSHAVSRNQGAAATQKRLKFKPQHNRVQRRANLKHAYQRNSSTAASRQPQNLHQSLPLQYESDKEMAEPMDATEGSAKRNQASSVSDDNDDDDYDAQFLERNRWSRVKSDTERKIRDYKKNSITLKAANFNELRELHAELAKIKKRDLDVETVAEGPEPASTSDLDATLRVQSPPPPPPEKKKRGRPPLTAAARRAQFDRLNREHDSPPQPKEPRRRAIRTASLHTRLPPRSGFGMIDLTTKEFHNNAKSGSNMFVYWNDPNELVSRLRLLVSSVSAGHTGHNNEILSIIEELREENIIE